MIWSDVLDWLVQVDKRCSRKYPGDLPPVNSKEFWWVATKLEMQHRDELSRKIEKILTVAEPPSMTDLDWWFYCRRVEWACQLVNEQIEIGSEPDSPLHDFLHWALIRSWHSDGCIAFWNNAERNGAPHPDYPIYPCPP